MSNQIPAVWAFVSIDPDGGDEGVVGVPSPDGWVPLICSDEHRREAFRELAQRIADHSRRPIRLLRFEHREEVETLLPGRRNAT